VHSATVSAARPLADISGWDTSRLALTPPAGYHGTLSITATATAVEMANGSSASISQTLTVQVDAVAQPPSLALQPRAVPQSRQMIATVWDDGAWNGRPSRIDQSQYCDWNVLPAANGMDPAFTVWHDGDRSLDAYGHRVRLHAPQGSDSSWLGLTNYGARSSQTLGIERDLPTQDGATYSLSFDYAGALGLDAAHTQLGVYLDGACIGRYSALGGASALAWQGVTLQYQGNGQPRHLRFQLEGASATSELRGAMLHGLQVVETLSERADTVYGIAGQAIALPRIAAQLAVDPNLAKGQTDPNARLKVELLGLPTGAVLSDGTLQATIGDDGRIDVTGWNLNQLNLQLDGCGEDEASSFTLQVRATAVEANNGSSASTTRDLAVQLLDGPACATPAGINPYVSYVNNAAISESHVADDTPTLSVTPLMPLMPQDGSCEIHVGRHEQRGESSRRADDHAISMEDWMHSLEQSIGAAFYSEMEKAQGGRTEH